MEQKLAENKRASRMFVNLAKGHSSEKEDPIKVSE